MISIVMGSDSDLTIMKAAAETLKEFKVPYELTIVSAHRTPDRMYEYARNAHKRGVKTIIAGAGGAAHLPGMLASLCPLPVIGVPIHSSNSIAGIDSLLSIVQMPNGIPVATVAVNGAKNAALLALRILGANDSKIFKQLEKHQQNLAKEVEKKITNTAKKYGKVKI